MKGGEKMDCSIIKIALGIEKLEKNEKKNSNESSIGFESFMSQFIPLLDQNNKMALDYENIPQGKEFLDLGVEGSEEVGKFQESTKGVKVQNPFVVFQDNGVFKEMPIENPIPIKFLEKGIISKQGFEPMEDPVLPLNPEKVVSNIDQEKKVEGVIEKIIIKEEDLSKVAEIKVQPIEAVRDIENKAVVDGIPKEVVLEERIPKAVEIKKEPIEAAGNIENKEVVNGIQKEGALEERISRPVEIKKELMEVVRNIENKTAVNDVPTKAALEERIPRAVEIKKESIEVVRNIKNNVVDKIPKEVIVEKELPAKINIKKERMEPITFSIPQEKSMNGNEKKMESIFQTPNTIYGQSGKKIITYKMDEDQPSIKESSLDHPSKSEKIIYNQPITQNSYKGIEKVEFLPKIENIHEVAFKMIEEIKEFKNKDHIQLQVKLKPESLGEIEIKLQMKDGQIWGKILVEHQGTKGVLENHLQQLKTYFKEQNIPLQTLDVNVSQYGNQQNHNQSSYYSKENSLKLDEQQEEELKQEYEEEQRIHVYGKNNLRSTLNLWA